MTIEEQTIPETSPEDITVTTRKQESQSHIIEAWTPTPEHLEAVERDLTRGDSPSAGAQQAPLAVNQWPMWLRRQWLATQRERAWQVEHPPTFASRVLSPGFLLALALVLVIGLTGVGLGASLTQGHGATGNTPAGGASMGAPNSASPAASSVPDATQQYGNQPARFVTDGDGVKHFTLTAQQVMWQPVKGHKVLAWTLDGTVPGPMIQAIAGEHLRITIVNHLPEATAIHWHGLKVPTDNDGVPPIGMKPIESGQSYTYDFTLRDEDAGTHWYHSHYDDLTQVGGGMYGAFIVAPRPGSPQYQPMMQAERADVDQTLFMGMLGGYFVIDGKSFPDTQPILVKHGQTVHLRLIGADTQMIHPMHLHGHSFQIVAEDGHLLPAPITKDTVDVSPGETFDATFYAWAAPGSVYPFHCHILTHLMNPGQSSGEMGGLITLVEYAQ